MEPRSITTRVGRVLPLLVACALAVGMPGAWAAPVAAVHDPDAPPVVRDGVRYQFLRGQVTGGFQLTPTRLSDTVQPGQSRSFELTVVNQTGHPQDFSVRAFDLAAGRSGRYSDLQPAGSTGAGAGEWIELPVEQLHLENLQQASFQVRVRADAKASAGGHYGAVVVGRTEAPGEGETVAVENRIVAQLVAMVPGDIDYSVVPSHLDVRREVTTGVPTADVDIDNRGDIHSSPVLTYRWEGRLGDSAKQVVNLPELLPGGSLRETIRMEDPPLVDIVRPVVTIATEDEREHRIVGDRVIVVRPPVIIAAAVLLALLVGWLVWRWHRNQKLIEHYLLGDDDEGIDGDVLESPEVDEPADADEFSRS
jgi:hypothetical protein